MYSREAWKVAWEIVKPEMRTAQASEILMSLRFYISWCIKHKIVWVVQGVSQAKCAGRWYAAPIEHTNFNFTFFKKIWMRLRCVNFTVSYIKTNISSLYHVSKMGTMYCVAIQWSNFLWSKKSQKFGITWLDLPWTKKYYVEVIWLKTLKLVFDLFS